MIPSDKMDSIQLTFHNLLFVPPGFNLLFPRGFSLSFQVVVLSLRSPLNRLFRAGQYDL
jgi:hypothetical protein